MTYSILRIKSWNLGLLDGPSKIGRWGNGHVEVVVERLDEIPYVVGLIRQALEIQLGEEN